MTHIFKIIVCLIFISISTNVPAKNFESLFMPGDISQAHAKFEQDCNQCHGTFKKERQDQLCLDCHDHKEVARDIKSLSGFHGRLKKAGQANCKQCHREHGGRNTPIVFINKGAFNHKLTDFQLKGAHKQIECVSCHKKNKPYRDASTSCYSCHKKNDVHKGKLGKKCQTCHVETDWKKSGFDHDKNTKFPLKGKHKKVECQLCHHANRFKKTPKQCVSCHNLNDPHAGEYGKKCHTCHSPKKWKSIHFNHKRDTDFPLTGKHTKLLCTQCHTGHLYKDKLKTNCHACHRNDDVHKGRNGNKCHSCHNTKSWSTSRFDHNKKTKFPLTGAHKKVHCESCHKGSVKKKTSKKCLSCHKHNDVHKTKMGQQCQQCHNTTGWSHKVFFEHDITRFPLIGLHAVTPCEECHRNQKYKGTPLKCVKCHKASDKHKGRFGTKCETCHNPNNWNSWLFDHDKQTTFTLDGAHKDLSCYSCHSNRQDSALKTAKSCVSCHRTDDIHNGRFGRRCEQCHRTTDFSDVTMQ